MKTIGYLKQAEKQPEKPVKIAEAAEEKKKPKATKK